MDEVQHERLGNLGISDLPRFVNLIVSEAKIGGGGLGVAAYNASARPILTRCHLAPLLRRVVLVGQPDLGKWLPETGKVFPLSRAR